MNTSNQCQSVVATNGIGPVVTDIGTQKANTTVLLQSLGSTDVNATLKSNSALLLQNPIAVNHSNNLKGRLNFISPNEGAGITNWGSGEFVITLGDCHPNKTMGDINYRPLADACDSGIGFSSGANSNPSNLSIGYASPVGHDWFIGTLLSGSPVASLRSTGFTFTIPLSVTPSSNSVVPITGQCGSGAAGTQACFQVKDALGNVAFQVLSNDQVNLGAGSTKAIGSNTASNSDLNGELSFSAVTTASYTFTGTYSVHPECVAEPQFDPGAGNYHWITYTSTTSFTINWHASVTGAVTYQCTFRN
jgi:hypothetical protein